MSGIEVKIGLDDLQYLKGLEQAQKKTQGFAQQAQGMLSQMSGGAGDILSGLAGGLVGGAVVGAIGKTVELLKGLANTAIETAKAFWEFSKEVGALQEVENTFASLVESYGGDANKFVDKLKEGTKGIVDDGDLMKSTIKGLRVAGDDMIAMAPKLAEMSVALARGSGKTVAEMYDQLVTATAKGKAKLLMNAGVNIKLVNQGIEEYTKSHVALGQELTENGKRQALFSGVMKAGADAMKRVDTETLTLTESMQKIQASTQGWKDALMHELAPALTLLFGDVANFTGMDIFTVFFADIGRSITVVASGVRQVVTELKLMWTIVSAFQIKLASLSGAFDYDLTKNLQKGIDKARSETKKNTDVALEALKNFAKMPRLKSSGIGGTGSEQDDIVKQQESAQKKQLAELERLYKSYTESTFKKASPMEAEDAEYNNLKAHYAAIANLTQHQKEELVKIEEARVLRVGMIRKKEAKEWMDVASKAVEGVSNIMTAASKLQEQNTQQQVEQLKRMNAVGDAFIDYRMQKSLQAAGVEDQTEAQRNAKEIQALQKQISTTTNLTKKKDLQAQLHEKQNEKKKLSIYAQAEADKETLTALINLRKNMILQKQFATQKAFNISMAVMHGATAVMAAWAGAFSTIVFPPAAAIVAGITTAAILAMMGVEVATIARQNFMPAYDVGAWNVARTSQAIVHQGEMIAPRGLAEDIRAGRASLGSGDGQTVNIHVHGSIIDGAGFKRAVKEALGGSRFKLNGVYA